MTSITRAALGALAFTVVAVAASAAQTATKIAYVNSQKLLPQAPGFADAQATVETEAEGVKAQEQKMSDSLQTMIADYTKLQPTLTAAQKTQHETTIKKKQQDFQQRAQQLEARATQHQAQLIQPIMDQIRQIIDQMRAEGGYAMIFDAGSQSGVVVSADTALDLTDKVIARLATSAPPKPAAKPPSAPVPSTKPTGVTRPPR